MDSVHTQTVVLPSLGLPYDGAIPDGKVQIEPFGVVEEELIQKPGSAARRQLITSLLSSCVKCAVPPDKLLIGDRLYLFMQLRRITLSDNWSFLWECSKCETVNNDSMLISEMPVHGPVPPEEGETIEWDNIKRVKLPVSGVTVGWRYLTGEDEVTVMANVSDMRKQGVKFAGDPAYSMRMALALTEVDGEGVDWIDAQNFIKNLHGRDSLAYRMDMEKKLIGINFEIERECIECGWPNTISIEFNLSEFFRPNRP